MSQEGRGCLVADQGGSDKVANLKSRVGGPDPQLPHWIRACILFTEGLERKWDFKFY